MPRGDEPFAVVDIGSNTVKLTIYRCGSTGGPEVLFHESDTVRIGHMMSQTGRISDERATRLFAALKDMERTAREHGATRFMAVATEAFRQAANGIQVRDEALLQTGWEVVIISGGDEAALTLEGARPFLTPGRRGVIADIGGASTEIVVVSIDGTMISGGSVPVGSGSLYDHHIRASPPPDGTLAIAANAAADLLRTSGLVPDRTDILLLPGGSGQLLNQLLGSIDPKAALDRRGMALLHDWLASMDSVATMKRLDIQVERAQVLPASLAIVEALVSALQPREIRAIPSGVGHGVAQVFCRSQVPFSI